MLYKNLLIFIHLIIAVALSQNLWAASNNVLESYSITPSGDEIKLIISFSQPVSYLSHFPTSKGKSLEIKLRPVQITGSILESTTFQDKLTVAQHEPETVSDIKYEQDVSRQGQLSIQFTRTISFSVKPARDRRSVTITIANTKAKKTENVTARLPEQTSAGLPIYVINLITSSEPIDANKQPSLKNFTKFDIYTTSSQVNWRNKYNLRIGYFYSKKAADANLKILKPFYKDAWVDRIKPERRQIAENWFLSKRINTLSTKPSDKKKTPPSKIDNLMERGKQAMVDKDYRTAIRYFSRILEYKDEKFHQEARELLGLARERNGQFAHAKAEYEQYLELYPEGEDAERVKQRLRGLITARSRDRKELKKNLVKGAEPEWNMFGSLSQFYRNQASATESTSAQTIDSSLLSDFIYSGRKRGLEWNQRFDIVANHRYDFLNSTDANNGNIYTLFYDLAAKDNDFAMRVGRQTHNSDGVLGRFDGLIVKKRIGNNMRVNFLAGYPVELSIKDSVDSTRQFYAASMDFESIFEKTDGKIFYISQENSGLTDRNALGTEVQYIDDEKSYFFLLDYDLHFGDLNQATFVGNWRNKNNSSLNIVADIRNSPLLTVNNALIGQTVSSIEQLRATLTDEEIKQLAQDRTADFWSLNISATTSLSDKYQLNGDVSVSNLSSTPASGGVAATTSTGSEYFYNLSLIANGFFLDNDITIMGLRYSDAATSSTLGMNISTRFKSSKPWRWNPRFSIDSRADDNGTDRLTYKTKLIVNYQPSREWKYEMELGYETSDTSTAAGDTSDETYYIFLGYIHDF